MSQTPRRKHGKDLKRGPTCLDCVGDVRVRQFDLLLDKYNKQDPWSWPDDKCARCGDLKVIWVDMFETNCPKCNPIKGK